MPNRLTKLPGAKVSSAMSATDSRPTTRSRNHQGRSFFGFSGSLSAGSAAAAPGAGFGAAETWIGGGGKVTSPSRVTVMLRSTSSSKSMTNRPSLAGVASLARFTMFVAYIWLDWAGRRLAMSV